MSTLLEVGNSSLNTQRSCLPSNLETNRPKNITSEEESVKENVTLGTYSIVRSMLSKSACCQYVNTNASGGFAVLELGRNFPLLSALL